MFIWLFYSVTKPEEKVRANALQYHDYAGLINGVRIYLEVKEKKSYNRVERGIQYV